MFILEYIFQYQKWISKNRPPPLISINVFLSLFPFFLLSFMPLCFLSPYSVPQVVIRFLIKVIEGQANMCVKTCLPAFSIGKQCEAQGTWFRRSRFENIKLSFWQTRSNFTMLSLKRKIHQFHQVKKGLVDFRIGVYKVPYNLIFFPAPIYMKSWFSSPKYPSLPLFLTWYSSQQP